MLGCAAMIKLAYCITRRRGRAARSSPATGAMSVQSHPAPHPTDLSPPFDGMAELWFDDLAALEAARRSPEWRASSADEAHFIDATRTALFLTEEHEILPQT